MNFEILCTGDELLTGLTVDTNSAFLAGRLLDRLGQRVARIQVVGDLRQDIVGALKEIGQRADAAVVCGGLGPTEDDLTAECAALASGTSLVEHPDTLAAIRRRFEKRGIAFTPNNARQARVPQGATVVPNPVGSAPMFIHRVGGCEFFFLPGVPKEFKHLVDTEVLPRLERRLQGEGARVHRAGWLLKTIGLPESHLDEKVRPLAQRHRDVVFGFRTHAPENHLKLLAEAPTEEQAQRTLALAREDCRALLQPWLFGEQDQTLAGNVGLFLKRKGMTVAVAESCTGGLVSQLLTEPAGASDWFVGGAVTYLESMKQRWADVSATSLALAGAVSEEVALQMAAGVRAQCGATFGLSVTGYAGPSGGTPQNPVGTVYLAMVWDGQQRCERHQFVGDRERVRQFAAATLLDMLRRQIC